MQRSADVDLSWSGTIEVGLEKSLTVDAGWQLLGKDVADRDPTLRGQRRARLHSLLCQLIIWGMDAMTQT